jgi:hypothetical protein
MNLRTIAISILFLLAAAACGGSDDDASLSGVASTSDSQSADTATDRQDTDNTDAAPVEDLVDTEDAVDDAIESGEEFAEDLVGSLEDAQDAGGGGSMTLTVGDQSWTYSPVLCAFGPEEIGQEGAEFVLSSIQDGKQMYVSIDVFGHSVSLNDVEDFENPSVSLGSFGGEEFISLDGKSFSGSAEFLDDTTDSFETIPGTFSGTCP